MPCGRVMYLCACTCLRMAWGGESGCGGIASGCARGWSADGVRILDGSDARWCVESLVSAGVRPVDHAVDAETGV